MIRITSLILIVIVFSSFLAAADDELFELTIICPDNYTFRMNYALMIKDEFEKVGLDVDVYFITLDEVVERCTESGGKLYKDGGFDIALFNWYFCEELGYWHLYGMFHSDNSVTKNPEGQNIMSWENAHNDELINKMEMAADETQFKEYLKQWQELFYEEQPMIPIYHFHRMEEDQACWEYSHLSLNLNHPDLQKKRVRQALSYLIPRQEICNLHNEDKENQWPGTFTSAEPCAVPYNPDLLEPYPYDPEYAKELLSYAGYTTDTPPEEGVCLGTNIIVAVVLCALTIIGEKRLRY